MTLSGGIIGFNKHDMVESIIQGKNGDGSTMDKESS